MLKLIKKIFGSRNERTLRRIEKIIVLINSFELKIKNLSNSELSYKTIEFKNRLDNGETLNNILPEAFAVVRETSSRTINLRHFDVQLIGGIVLHEGNIAEMRTGEGKTLVATLPAYLNALTGKGVHIITVNDYLAKRDSQWMKPIYKTLGMTLGIIHQNMSCTEKKSAYEADIVYGTNNEFGFDYLRDNMVFCNREKVQKELNFAIIDEVDSILIDEARTPLIISGDTEDSSELYIKINKLISNLKKKETKYDKGDYIIDEKQKQVYLTEHGHKNIEKLLEKNNLINKGESLYYPSNSILMYHIYSALKANIMFHKNIDYIVADNKIIIVDEHTGRTMPGRRWAEGLHQAIEAKEKVPIQNENQTLASITFQNYFRMYNKLSGMTGTADTEAYEFQQIYNLEVVVIPTNKPMRRIDQSDLVYLTQKDKYQAIINDVQSCITRNQPVLVGTTSIETSEILSNLMKKYKIKHKVLNAKFHDMEAEIISEAGRPGAVTIATNMAGRGTDIVLGGNLSIEILSLSKNFSNIDKENIIKNWKKRNTIVLNAGGLRVIGSERHESRRIDNQLRGRSGRQGDIGSSRFYLSLEDNLMRIFASERVSLIMKKLGMQSSEPIEHHLVTKAIENAQRKLEGHNFDIRKQLLEYDNITNEHRTIIYNQRSEIMKMESFHELICNMLKDTLKNIINNFISQQITEKKIDINYLFKLLIEEFKLNIDLKDFLKLYNMHHKFIGIEEKIFHVFLNYYKNKVRCLEKHVLLKLEKSIILQTIDNCWKEHLSSIDYLRQGIHLRGYAHKDPKQEYKKEAFFLFSAMINRLKYEIIYILFSLNVNDTYDLNMYDKKHLVNKNKYQYLYDKKQEKYLDKKHVIILKNIQKNISRNSTCPCGSGKKFNICHKNKI